jgi:hypothetical protein
MKAVDDRSAQWIAESRFSLNSTLAFDVTLNPATLILEPLDAVASTVTYGRVIVEGPGAGQRQRGKPW